MGTLYPDTPHLMHVTRAEEDGQHTGRGAGHADSPGQAVDHQPPQPLAQSVLHLLVTHLCQQLLERGGGTLEHNDTPACQLYDRQGEGGSVFVN